MQIKSLQNTIDQGGRLDNVDLDTNGDYTGINNRLFLLDLPADGNMKVQFADDTIGTYSFYEGTRPMVKIKKVFDVGSIVRQFTVIYQ